jgi:calcium/calmodulin-dependent protein kinase I
MNHQVKYHIVTDLVEGGELFERITDRGRISEPDAQSAVRDIIAAVEYLHDNGIVHRRMLFQD